MPRLALGLIETIGLAAAVEAADAAVKSANIALLGYELSNGGGMVTVKLEGDVGAIKAAVEAGCAAAERVNKVWSKQIIPRPHEELDKMVYSKATVGIAQPLVLPEINDVIETTVETGDARDTHEAEPDADDPKEEHAGEISDQGKEQRDKFESDDKECCNLCFDPLCSRKKGELRSTCIHYEELKEVL